MDDKINEASSGVLEQQNAIRGTQGVFETKISELESKVDLLIEQFQKLSSILTEAEVARGALPKDELEGLARQPLPQPAIDRSITKGEDRSAG